MITEDYVSFETAKLLKEKGFDENCLRSYVKDKLALSTGFNNSYYEIMYPDGRYRPIAAPTLQMAMKWLREERKLQVNPRYDEVDDEKELLHYVWFFEILSMNPYKMLSESEHGYNIYEEACEAAIKYCLENLI